MANTYTQLNVHAVFAVKGRQNFLGDKIRPALFQYIHGILKNINQFPLAINGWKDHVHIFFELSPDVSLSKVMEVVKSNSSKWINSQGIIKGKFEWQKGYGGFTYSRSQRNNVIQYIINQEEHHRPKENSFKKEYLTLLENFEIEYNPLYNFEFYNDEQ